MDLVTVWFALVVLCWVLFCVLEGFDFGVGVLAPVLGRDDSERGAVVRTVGPFWDGNEVWLVAAIGVTFAAFPDWYAAMLSGLYLPFALFLLLLAGRGVALEFRAKGDGLRWRRRCDAALALCSAGVVALLGAVLAVLAVGLPLGPDGEVASRPGALAGLGRSTAPLLSPEAGAGAVLALLVAVLLGATFLGLRTTGPVRERARRVAVRVPLGAAAVALLVAAAGWTAAGTASAAAAALVLLAVLAHHRREAAAFGLACGLTALAVVLLFTANGDVVLPSTLDPAASLTRSSAAATDSALRLVSAFAVVVLPGVVAYQALSYWVFRRRVGSERTA
ncbi:cytochrome d ubiquinol oxidase subunit II [Kineococcus xinjiangensis]|uniref:Cytochrome d ubiquinol oxidase subunit II n=1 Tax=Kineococcus xinjiangensis TaxID=512762 RepID=A0A2S6IT14_9ACTN|nr:cytochrome d ubiquinol oxidase subunit II [Kineococcus xinjiangensis]